MTKEQKTLILYYREQHMTYRQIGEKLGLSPDTVKTFCRRNTPQEDRTEASASSQCRNCGAPVHPLPGRRERLFCSPACRTAYCALLTGGSASRKYCSHACYIRHRFGSSAAPSAPQREAKTPHLEKAEPLVPLLTKEQFERELNYRVALSIARQMREGGLVTLGEFVQIDRFLRRKFSPVWGGLYQNNP